ncbi:recombinase family protein [Eubacterium sp.]|uniref:recombinase family protein n=1 Tax=Eubacterium sp. TaxID=142586 RepID=UPI0026E047A5|nr:recombinase family protein [Eubacterium sp.]MDO5433357.1 recombinase family protein [Eubacterium sp.]
MVRNRFEHLAGLRTGAYIRVSHEEQVKNGYSLDAQRENLQQFIKENRLKLVDFYMDEGISARKNPQKRKEFKRMISDVEAGNLDLIIFIKLDRWFRNIQEYYIAQQVLDKNNVQWVSTMEDYDTTTASGRLNLNIRLSIAQDEADRTSERIKFVFENKLKNKEVITGACPLGYKIENKHYVIDEETAPIARAVFKEYNDRQSKRKTMDAIYAQFGMKLCARTVDRIIKNRLYIGEYHEIPGFAPALIDEDFFNEVNALFEKRSIRNNRTGRIFIFSGLITCKECGCNYQGASVKYHNQQGPQVILHYRCAKHYLDNSCGNNKTVNEKKLETYLLKNIRPLMEQHVDYLIKKAKETAPKNDGTKIKRRMEKLKELYVADLIDIDDYRRDYEECQQALSKIEAQKNKALSPDKIDAAKKFLSMDFEDIYDALSREERQMFWRKIIKKIIFDPETRTYNVLFL